jgi:YHS domain-containing protein
MKFKHNLTIAIFITITMTFVSIALAVPQTTCPVMGGDINKDIYADHAGKRVYFCCPMCDRPFKKNPEKYLKKLKKLEQEVETLKKK